MNTYIRNVAQCIAIGLLAHSGFATADTDPSFNYNYSTGQTKITGTAIDPDRPSTAVRISFWVEGNGTTVYASGGSFSYTIPSQFYDGKTHTVDMYVINIKEDGSSPGTPDNRTKYTQSVKVTPNRGPVASNDSGSVNEDSSRVVSVLSNDSDPDGDSISISSVQSPRNGSASKNGSSITYTPNRNFCGSDSFTYRVTDGKGLESSATVNMTVQCVNDSPVINSQRALSVNAGSSITLSTNDFSISDPDSNTFSLSVSSGSNYSVSGTTVTPNANYSGTLLVPVTVSDGRLSSSFSARVTVNSVNTKPVGAVDTYANDGQITGWCRDEQVHRASIWYDADANGSINVANGDSHVGYAYCNQGRSDSNSGYGFSISIPSQYKGGSSERYFITAIDYDPNGNAITGAGNYTVIGTPTIDFKYLSPTVTNIVFTKSSPATIMHGDSIGISAVVNDPDNQLQSGRILVNGSPISSGLSASWMPSNSGTYTIKAEATGVNSQTASSMSTSYTVTVDSLPQPTAFTCVGVSNCAQALQNEIDQGGSSVSITLTAGETYCINSSITVTAQNFELVGQGATLKQCKFFEKDFNAPYFEDQVAIDSLFTFKKPNGTSATVNISNLKGIFEPNHTGDSRIDERDWWALWMSSSFNSAGISSDMDIPARNRQRRTDAFLSFTNIDDVNLSNLDIRDFSQGIYVRNANSYKIDGITYDGIMDNINDIIPLKTSVNGKAIPINYLILERGSALQSSTKETNYYPRDPVAGEYDWTQFQYVYDVQMVNGNPINQYRTLGEKVCPSYGASGFVHCTIGGNWNKAIFIDREPGCTNEASCPRSIKNVNAVNSGSAINVGNLHRFINIDNVTCNAPGQTGNSVHWDNCVYLSSAFNGDVNNVKAYNLAGAIVKTRGALHTVSQIQGNNVEIAYSGQSTSSPAFYEGTAESGFILTPIPVPPAGSNEENLQRNCVDNVTSPSKKCVGNLSGIVVSGVNVTNVRSSTIDVSIQGYGEIKDLTLSPQYSATLSKNSVVSNTHNQVSAKGSNCETFNLINNVGLTKQSKIGTVCPWNN